MDPQENEYLLLLPSDVRHSEFKALLTLMDDDDQEVLELVKQKIVGYGRAIAPVLRWLREKHENLLIRLFSDESYERFQKDTIASLISMALESETSAEALNLEQMLIKVSQFGYPEILPEDISEQLDAMALRVHQHFIKSPQATELNLLLSINRVFFEEEGFSGVRSEKYYVPDMSFIHHVLQEKVGIPISLSCLYLLVAERAGVTLHGIGMPAHFLVYHPELDIYIDTFNNGVFLTHNDCKQFIVQSGFVYDPTMLQRVSNLAILLRFTRNLMFAYEKQQSQGYWERQLLEELSHTIIEVMNQEDNDYGEPDSNSTGER